MQSIASATRYLKSQDNTASDSEWPWQIRNTSGPNKAPEPQTSLFRTPWTCQVWRVVIFRVPFAKFWQMSLFSQARVEIASLRTILNIQKNKKWRWYSLVQIWICLGVSNQCCENFKPDTSMAIHCSGVQYPPGKRTPRKGGEFSSHKQNPVVRFKSETRQSSSAIKAWKDTRRSYLAFT